MDWLGQLLGLGLGIYQKKKDDKASAKQAMIDFQLQKQQLAAQVAASNAQAEAAKAAAAQAGASSKAPASGMPKWLVPAAVGTVAVVGLAIAMRPRS